MDPKGTVNTRPAARAFPLRKKAEIERRQGSIAVFKACADNPHSLTVWQQFLSRFLGKIRFFVSKANRLQSARNFPEVYEMTASQPFDPEDLVQEVLVRLAANECQLLKAFEGTTDASLFRYLEVICTCAVIDHHRYLRRQRRFQDMRSLIRVDPELLERIGISRDDLRIQESILVKELIEMVITVLQKEIPESDVRNRYLLIFKLHLLEGLSFAEISRYCGINLSKKGVDKAVAKIINSLKVNLKQTR